MPSATPSPQRATLDARSGALGFDVALDAADETIAMVRPIVDDQGRFVDAELLFANAAALRRWAPGPREAIVGRRLFETAPALRPLIFHLYRNVVETGVPYRGRDIFPTPEGSRTIDVAITPFEGGLVHVGRDVTAAADAMAALAATERRLRERTAELEALAHDLEEARDIAGLGVFRRDLGTGELTWSPQVYRVFGLDPDSPAPTAEQVQALFTPESNRRRREANEESARTGRPWDIELEVVRPDGERRWIIQRGRPGVDADGRVTGYLGTVIDITERRRAEEELRVVAARMARLASAIDQATESVIVTDTAATILYVNPAFERITGYPAAEAIGRNPRFLKSGLVTRETYRDLWATLLRGDAWHGELVNRRSDGTLFTEDASISPIRDETGAVVSYVAVKRDITGVRSLEAQLRQAQRLEAIGRLAGGVAHDFNNLLTAIRGYGELVLDGLPATDGARADVTELLRAADRASALTHQLLAFSRRQEMVPEVVDPAGVIDELVPMLRRLLGEHITLATRHPARLGRVRVDPVQLEQVVVNLAVNARDAMPDGGRLEITTADIRGPVGPVVRITVTDTGAGMDQATLTRAFEPFFTTKEQGKGTGMGLATVFGIVSQSGGTLDVRSQPGEGTSFAIDLPAVASDAGAREAAEGNRVGRQAGDDAPGGRGTADTAHEDGARDDGAPSDVVGHGAPHAATDTIDAFPAAADDAPPGARTILLVEDQPSVRAVAVRILSRLGHRVVEAASGADAMAVARSLTRPLDLLLTDVRMPGMQGPELARRLRAERPGLRVLFMSGFAADAWASGEPPEGTRVLDKPFDADTLGRAVEDALADGG